MGLGFDNLFGTNFGFGVRTLYGGFVTKVSIRDRVRVRVRAR